MDENTHRILVREAVEETLMRLGFSLDNHTELQADMLYLRKSRKGSEELAKWIKRSAIGVSISASLFALWEGLKSLLKQ